MLYEHEQIKQRPDQKVQPMGEIEFANYKKQTNFLRVYYARKNKISDVDNSWESWYKSYLFNLNSSSSAIEHDVVEAFIRNEGLSGIQEYFERVIKNNLWQPDNYQNTFRAILGKTCPYGPVPSHVINTAEMPAEA